MKTRKNLKILRQTTYRADKKKATTIKKEKIA